MITKIDWSRLDTQTPEEKENNRKRTLELLEKYKVAQEKLEEYCKEKGITIPDMICSVSPDMFKAAVQGTEIIEQAKLAVMRHTGFMLSGSYNIRIRDDLDMIFIVDIVKQQLVASINMHTESFMLHENHITHDELIQILIAGHTPSLS